MKFKITARSGDLAKFGTIRYSYELHSLCGNHIKQHTHPSVLEIGDIVSTHFTSCYHRVSERLAKIGITVEFASNYPWVYLHKVNGVKVTSHKHASQGWCVGYSDDMRNITYRKDMFNKIRECLAASSKEIPSKRVIVDVTHKDTSSKEHPSKSFTQTITLNTTFSDDNVEALFGKHCDASKKYEEGRYRVATEIPIGDYYTPLLNWREGQPDNCKECGSIAFYSTDDGKFMCSKCSVVHGEEGSTF